MTGQFFIEGKNFISADDAAVHSGYTRDHIARLCREGKLEGKKIGTNWYVGEDALGKMLALAKSGLFIGGKHFISADDAVTRSGYTRDHITRLCREGKLEGTKVGATWYVEETSLQDILTTTDTIVADGKRYISASEAAKTIGYARNYILQLCRDGRVDAQKVGDSWLVEEGSVKHFFLLQQRLKIARDAQLAEDGRKERSGDKVATSQTGYSSHSGLLTPPKGGVQVQSYTPKPRRSYVGATAFLVCAFLLGAGYMLADGYQNGTFAMPTLPEQDALLASVGSADVNMERISALAWDFLQTNFSRTVTFTRNLSSAFFGVHTTGNVSVEIKASPRPTIATSPNITSVAVGAPATQTIINQPVIERIRESVKTITMGGISEEALAASLQQLDNKLSSQIANVTASGNATYQVVAQTNRIDQLSGTDLTNITVHGVSGLAASDIPALSYFAATSTISIAYGGTGTSTAPTYGQMLVGNSVGGYDLLATSTLGVTSSQWTTSGSDIYYTTGNTGIGTTTPTYKLSVEGISSLGNQAIAGYFTATSTNVSSFAGGFTAYASSTIGAGTQTTGLTISGGATTTGNAYIAGNVGIGTTTPWAQFSINPTIENGTAPSFVIGSSTATKFIVTNTGSVGIGTNQPLNNFVVSDAGAGGLEVNPSLTIGAAVGVRFLSYDRSASAYRDFIFAQNGSYTVIGANGSVGIASTTPWGRLSVDTTGLAAGVPEFTVGSSTRQDFVITQAGYVGIGTTTPDDSLTVYGNLGGGGVTVRSTTGAGINLDRAATSNAATVTFFTAGTQMVQMGLDNDGTNKFHIGGDSMATKWLTIDTSGSVGIGTTSPSFRLEALQGSSGTLPGINIGEVSTTNRRATLGFGLNGALTSGWIMGQSLSNDTTKDFYLYDVTAGAARLYINTSGNVGIGTTTPVNKLAITGADDKDTGPIINLAGNTTNQVENGRIRFTEQGDYIGTYIAYNGSTNVMSLGVHNTADSLTASDTNVLNIIRGTGRVGIGTTTATGASVLLHVKDGSVAQTERTLLRLEASESQANTGVDLDFAQGGFITGRIGNVYENTGQVGLAFSSYNSGLGERLRISAAGNVGIGDASPTSLLTVGSGDYFQVDAAGTIFQDRADATYDIWMQGSAPGTTGNARHLALLGTAAGLLYLNYSSEYTSGTYIGGNVGINDSNPTEGTLVVGASGNGSIYFTPTVTTATKALCYDGTTASLIDDCSGTPVADYAEMYPVAPDVTYGDIVALGTDMVNTYDNDGNGTTWDKVLGQVSRAVKAQNQHLMFGVVSNNYFDFSSTGNNIKESDHPMPVALNGRVPVTVNLEGGPIAVGDAITLSSIPGVGTKATTTSQTIGIALEPLTSTGGAATAHILVFVKPELTFAGESLDTLAALNELGTNTASTSSPQATPFVQNFFANVFARVSGWLASADNGITDLFAMTVHAKNIFADTVNAKTLCLDDVCVTRDQLKALLDGQVAAAAGAGNSGQQTVDSGDGGAGTSDTIPPAIILTGASSITIAIGDTYSDLGATVTDNVNNNLGYTISLDGATSTTPDQLSLDTSIAGTHTILFSATDQAGNTGTATRTVIVGDESPVNSEQQTDNSGGNTATTTTSISDTTATSTDPVSIPEDTGISTSTPGTQ